MKKERFEIINDLRSKGLNVNEGKYNMLLNAKNFVVNFQINDDELTNIYQFLKQKYDFVSEV